MNKSEVGTEDLGSADRVQARRHKAGRAVGNEKFTISIKSIEMYLDGSIEMDFEVWFNHRNEAREWAIRQVKLAGVYDLRISRGGSDRPSLETFRVNG